MTEVLDALKALMLAFLSSKKAMATGVTLVVAGIARLGFHVDGSTLLGFLGFVSAYVLAQGVADNGKEAAKITAATLSKPIRVERATPVPGGPS